MYCCILRNESGLWHTFSDKIFLENFLENSAIFSQKSEEAVDISILGVGDVMAHSTNISKRNFYSDLFIFDNISGGVVCIWENRDSGSRLYVCMYGMSFRRGCSDTGVSDRVFWILSTTVVF